jgi:hypothetical protein
VDWRRIIEGRAHVVDPEVLASILERFFSRVLEWAAWDDRVHACLRRA